MLSQESRKGSTMVSVACNLHFGRAGHDGPGDTAYDAVDQGRPHALQPVALRAAPLSFPVVVWLGLATACNVAESPSTGDTTRSNTSDSGAQSDAFTADTSASTAPSIDTGECDADCCSSVPNPAEICAAAQTEGECEMAQVGDDWCFWVEWQPTTFDGLSCSFGASTFECRYQSCQSEGCAGFFGCTEDGTHDGVVRDGPDGPELGIGRWCLPPVDAVRCQWDFDAMLVDSPPECVCGCPGSNLCDVPFDGYIDVLASGGDSHALDCGALADDDSVANWEVAHDCALTAAAGGVTFILSWGPTPGDIEMGEDSKNAIVGRQGESYEIVRVYATTEHSIDQQTCTGLTATPDCTVGVGEPCITCMDPSATEQVCPES
jgi:hypothetical protein